MTKQTGDLSGMWPPSMAPVAERLRANTELITQINLIVSRAAQTMAARQSAAITEAVSDMSTLMRAAMPNPNDPAATARAYSAYVETVVQRGMSQLSFSIETIAEMNASALDLARRRVAADEQVEPDPAPRAPTPRK